MTDETKDTIEQIAALTDADAVAPPLPPVGGDPQDLADDDDNDAAPPPPEFGEQERRSIDMAAVAANAAEPQNDTGNGQRLLRHFGGDLLNVREMSTEREAAWHRWDGARWQREGGNEFALLCAQRCAPRIQLEADYITATPGERFDIERGEEAEAAKAEIEKKPKDQLTEADKKRLVELGRQIDAGEEAVAALRARQLARRKFAVSSGNGNRLMQMLKQALPHKTVSVADLDADPLAFNCESGTLRFVEVADLECPDPDVVRKTWTVRLDPHNPGDLISKLAPVAYRADAVPKQFLTSLERFQPNAAKRRWLQKYHGYAMTGLNGEQCALFNYGGGSNWKSTFVEIVARVMGDYADMIKFESLAEVGSVTGAQANPDFARLPGKRFVRTTEVERGVPLKEGLIKSITSGEPWLTRHNFGNFFSFYPSFKIAMPGNNKPEIGGGDHGIWRRIRFVIWPVTITDEEKRNIEDVLAELWEERDGILAWLVDGALAYLNEGLAPPREIVDETAEYREEMDVIGAFIGACVTVLTEQEGVEPPFVAAADVYDAFDRWCAANNVRAWKQKAFGSGMSQKGVRKSRKPGIRGYIWIALHDVPARKHRHDEPPHPADSSDEVPL